MLRVHAPAGYGNGEVLHITALVSEAGSKAKPQAHRNEHRRFCRSFMTAPNEAKWDLRARVHVAPPILGRGGRVFVAAAALARRAR